MKNMTEAIMERLSKRPELKTTIPDGYAGMVSLIDQLNADESKKVMASLIGKVIDNSRLLNTVNLYMDSFDSGEPVEEDDWLILTPITVEVLALAIGMTKEQIDRVLEVQLFSKFDDTKIDFYIDIASQAFSMASTKLNKTLKSGYAGVNALDVLRHFFNVLSEWYCDENDKYVKRERGKYVMMLTSYNGGKEDLAGEFIELFRQEAESNDVHVEFSEDEMYFEWGNSPIAFTGDIEIDSDGITLKVKDPYERNIIVKDIHDVRNAVVELIRIK